MNGTLNLGMLELELGLNQQSIAETIANAKAMGMQAGKAFEQSFNPKISSIDTRELDKVAAKVQQVSKGLVLDPKVNTKEVHDLNKLFDLKASHCAETNRKLKLYPKVDLTDLTAFDQRLKVLESANGKKIAIKFAVDDSDISKQIEAAVKLGVSRGLQAAEVGDLGEKRRSKDERKAKEQITVKTESSFLGGLKTGLLEGTTQAFGLRFGNGLVGGFEKALNTNLKKAGDDVGQRYAQMGANAANNFAKSFGLKDGLQPAVEEFNQVLFKFENLAESAAGNIGNTIREGLLGNFQEAKNELLNLGKDIASVSVDAAFAPVRVRKREVAKDAVKQAIDKKSDIEIDRNKAIEEAQSITIATGGLNFSPGGKENTDFISDLLKPILPGSYIVGMNNPATNDPSGVPEKFNEYVGKIGAKLGFDTEGLDVRNVGKLLEMAIIKGINPDAITMAATAAAYKAAYPDKPVQLVGTSGGGHVANDAIALLEMMGVDAKGIGITTPFAGLADIANPEKFRAQIGTADPLYQRMFGMGIFRPGESQDVFEGVGLGHLLPKFVAEPKVQESIKGFLGDNIGEISPDVSGKKGYLNMLGFYTKKASDAGNIKGAIANVQGGNEQSWFYNDENPLGRLEDLQGYIGALRDVSKKAKGDVQKEAEEYLSFLEQFSQELELYFASGKQAIPNLEKAQQYFPDAVIAEPTEAPIYTDKSKQQALNDFRYRGKALAETGNFRRTIDALRGNEVDGYSFKGQPDSMRGLGDHLKNLAAQTSESQSNIVNQHSAFVDGLQAMLDRYQEMGIEPTAWELDSLDATLTDLESELKKPMPQALEVDKVATAKLQAMRAAQAAASKAKDKGGELARAGAEKAGDLAKAGLNKAGQIAEAGFVSAVNDKMAGSALFRDPRFGGQIQIARAGDLNPLDVIKIAASDTAMVFGKLNSAAQPLLGAVGGVVNALQALEDATVGQVPLFGAVKTIMQSSGAIAAASQVPILEPVMSALSPLAHAGTEGAVSLAGGAFADSVSQAPMAVQIALKPATIAIEFGADKIIQPLLEMVVEGQALLAPVKTAGAAVFKSGDSAKIAQAEQNIKALKAAVQQAGMLQGARPEQSQYIIDQASTQIRQIGGTVDAELSKMQPLDRMKPEAANLRNLKAEIGRVDDKVNAIGQFLQGLRQGMGRTDDGVIDAEYTVVESARALPGAGFDVKSLEKQSIQKINALKDTIKKQTSLATAGDSRSAGIAAELQYGITAARAEIDAVMAMMGKNASKELKQAAKNLRSQATRSEKAIAGVDTSSIGADVAAGMNIGLTTGLAELQQSGAQLAQAVIQGAESTLEIKSPSRVFVRIGQFIVQGLEKGIEGLENLDVKSKLQNVTDEAGETVSGLIPTFGKIGELGMKAFGMLPGPIKLVAAALIGFDPIQQVTQWFMSLTTAARDAALEMQKFQRILDATAKGGSQKAMPFLGGLSDRLGTNFRESIGSYGQLASSTRETALEGASTEQIQRGLSVASAAFGLDSEQQKGAMLAMSQMASKGTVSMEELRQQLSERIPGAMQIAARSMGVTTAELNAMVSSGQVAAEDFLPRFAQQMEVELAGSAERGSKTAQASFNRLDNAIFKTQAAIGEGVLPVQKIGADVAVGALSLIANNADMLTNVLQALAIMAAGKAAMAMLTLAKNTLFANGVMAATGGSQLGLQLLATGNAAGFAGAKILEMSKTAFTALNNSPFLVWTAGIAAAIAAIKAITDISKNASGEIGKIAEESRKSNKDFNDFMNSIEKRKKKGGKDDPTQMPSIIEQMPVFSAIPQIASIGGEDAKDSALGWMRRWEKGAQSGEIPTLPFGLDKSVKSTAGFFGSLFQGGNFGDAVKAGIGAMGDKRTLQDIQGEAKKIDLNQNIENANAATIRTLTKLGTSGKGVAELSQLKKINEDLNQVRLDKQSLKTFGTPGDPANQKKLEELNKKERELNAQRSESSEVLRKMNAENAAQIQSLKKQLEQLDPLSEEYKQAESALRALEDAQTRFNQQMKSSTLIIDVYAREWDRAVARLQDAKTAIDVLSSQQSTMIGSAELSNNVNQAGAEYLDNLRLQNTELAKQQQNLQKIAELQAMQSNPEVQAKLSAYKIDGGTGAAEITALANDEKTPAPDKEILTRAAQLRTLQDETAQMGANITQAQVAAKRKLDDSSRAIRDFFRGVQQSAETMALDARAVRAETAALASTNKIKSALSKGMGDFADSLSESFISIIQSFSNITKNTLDLEKLKLSQSQGMQNLAVQAAELARNNVPMMGGGIPGVGGGSIGGSVAGVGTAIRVVRTGQKDKNGLEVLQVQNVVNGQIVDSVLATSGVASNQRFESLGAVTQGPGSLAPIPAGAYKLGAPEFGDFGNTIGNTWIDILDKNTGSSMIGGANGRGAFGLHEDANLLSGSPGSAGCVVFYDKAAIDKVAGWVGKGGQKELIVDWSAKGQMGGGALPSPSITQPQMGQGGGFSYEQLMGMMQGGSNSMIAKIVGMAEGNRTADGAYTKHAYGHTDPGNGAWNIGSFSAQGELNDGTIEGSDNRVIDRLLRPNIQKLYSASQAQGVAVTPKLLLNYIDLLNQAPDAATGWHNGAGMLGRLGTIRGRENDDEAIKALRAEGFRNNQGRLETTFSSLETLKKDQARRMSELNAAIGAFGLKGGGATGGGVGAVGMPSIGPSGADAQQIAINGQLIQSGLATQRAANADFLAAQEEKTRQTNLAELINARKQLTQTEKMSRDNARAQERARNAQMDKQEDDELALLPDNAQANFRRQSVAQARKTRDQKLELKQSIEDSKAEVDSLKKLREEAKNAAGVPDDIKTPFLGVIDSRIADYEKSVKTAESAFAKIDEIDKKINAKNKAQMEADQKREQLAKRRRDFEAESAGVKDEITNLQLAGRPAEANELQRQLDLKQQILDTDEKIFDVEERQRLNGLDKVTAEAEVAKLKDNQARASAEINRLATQRELQRRVEEASQLSAGRKDFSDARIQQLRYQNNPEAANELQSQMQLTEQRAAFAAKLTEYQQLKDSGRLSQVAFEELNRTLRETNEIRLDNITREAEKLKEASAFNQLQARFGMQERYVGAQIENTRLRGGRTEDAEKAMAIAQADMDYISDLQNIRNNVDLTVESQEKMIASAGKIRDLKLDNAKRQFSELNQISLKGQEIFADSIAGLLDGSKSLGDVLRDGIKSLGSFLAKMAGDRLSKEVWGIFKSPKEKAREAEEAKQRQEFGAELSSKAKPTDSIVQSGVQFKNIVLQAAYQFRDALGGLNRLGADGNAQFGSAASIARFLSPDSFAPIDLAQTVDAGSALGSNFGGYANLIGNNILSGVTPSVFANGGDIQGFSSVWPTMDSGFENFSSRSSLGSLGNGGFSIPEPMNSFVPFSSGGFSGSSGFGGLSSLRSEDLGLGGGLLEDFGGGAIGSSLVDGANQAVTALQDGTSQAASVFAASGQGAAKGLGQGIQGLMGTVDAFSKGNIWGGLGGILSMFMPGGGLLGGLFGGGKFAGGMAGEEAIPIANMASGGLLSGISDAMARERSMSSGNPVLLVANDREMILNERQTQRYQELGLEQIVNGKIPNYAMGGMAGCVPNYSDGGMVDYSSTPETSIGNAGVVGGNQPIVIHASGNVDEDALRGVVEQEMSRQSAVQVQMMSRIAATVATDRIVQAKRPGGLLS